MFVVAVFNSSSLSSQVFTRVIHDSVAQDGPHKSLSDTWLCMNFATV
jgi:hypothetical protein